MMIKNLPNQRFWKVGLIVAAITVSLLIIARFTFASTPTLKVSPASQKVPKGSTFAVQVRIASQTPLNAAQANLRYSPNLEVVSIAYGGSAFGTEIQSIYGNGSVRMGRLSLTPVSGDTLFATVTFRAIGGGSAAVTFDAGSDLASAADGSNVLGSTINGQYKIAGR